MLLLIPVIFSTRTKTDTPQPVPQPASFPFTLPYEPIVSDPVNPVGNISITNIALSPGFNFTYGNVSFKWDNASFIQASSFARMDTSTLSGSVRTSSIFLTWYEYLEFSKTQQYVATWYNYSSKARLAQLDSVEYNTTKGWGNLVPAPASYYENFLNVTNPSEYRYVLNFSLGSMNVQWNTATINLGVLIRLKYSHQIPITQWQVIENSTAPIALPNIVNTITNKVYNETFRISDPTLISGSDPLLNATIAYVPFNRDGVAFISLWNRSVGGNYQQVLTPKYKITLPTNNMTFPATSNSEFLITFSANFTIQFDQPLNPPDIYAVDRLASDNDIREHWYYVKVTGGPNLLRIQNLVFNDTNVAYQDTFSTSTYFGRPLSKDWNNVTIVEDEITNEINNGTTLTGGYFVSGETDVMMLSYLSERNLTILIADQILTPVPGAAVTLLRDGIRFGSYISEAVNFTQPPKLADERGIVVFPHLPSSGNYSVRVDYAGGDYGIYYTDIMKAVNIITTTIPHFPTWIIIWSSFCAVITIIGFSKYKQYRTHPETETR